MGSAIEIHVNGAPRSVPVGSTAADLVAALGVRPELVAIELDGKLVPKAQRATTPLVAGARVEIVTLVGGG